ncbi:hypothetical protein [Listeria ilorinensis]|uniref:hypothetical protein n=1 Tax=Listeria ilorinensis TaxID=2867439 RepID=UPI001EF49F9F|nr:hypothetical protein [Listeria ilorinensis]
MMRKEIELYWEDCLIYSIDCEIYKGNKFSRVERIIVLRKEKTNFELKKLLFDTLPNLKCVYAIDHINEGWLHKND